jgi:hypothetical protein
LQQTCAAAGVTEFTDGGTRAGHICEGVRLQAAEAILKKGVPTMNTVMPPRPDFTDPDGCLAWLVGLNPTNAGEAHATLAGMLAALLEVPPAPLRHLEIVEQARPALDFVQNRFAQRYASRPLPPVSQEDETLRVVLNLWQLMLRSYALIAQRSALDPGFLDRRPLLAQRRLHYHGALILEYYRARRETPPGIWAELHRLYSAAEEWNVAKVRIAEPLNETWHAQSCTEAYLAVLLVEAANPYGRTPREFAWILNWAQRFAPHCSLHKDINPEARSGYVLDLARDFALRPQGDIEITSSLRRVDNRRLAAHIQAIIAQFKNGATPASLGLGDDCVQPACARLLISLYRPWGLSSAGRRFPRRATQGTMQIASDLPSIGYYIADTPFAQPPKMRSGTFRDTQSVYTIGEQVEKAPPSDAEIYSRAALLGMILEHWNIIDQSVSGFRIVRDGSGSRIDHRQLVAVRPADGESFLLAEICWLMYRFDGRLFAGIALMPGLPQVVAARIRNHSGTGLNENYHQAFLLPEIEALRAHPSLVVPAGWYTAGRELDICANGEKDFQVKLQNLIARGINFDRVGFLLLES